MKIFKPFAIACSLLAVLLHLPLSLAASAEPAGQQTWEAAAAGEVDVVTFLSHFELHPSTTKRTLNVLYGAHPEHLQEAPSFLRDVATSRHLQEERPTYLFVQMFDECIFQTTDSGIVVVKSRHPHGQTVQFSDRPFTYEQTITTEEFFDTFPDKFNDDNGGMPNSAITLVQDDESKDVVVAVFAKAVIKHREDPDGPTYVYKLEQSDEQASVTSLSDILGGKNKVTYDHCSIFIDSWPKDFSLAF